MRQLLEVRDEFDDEEDAIEYIQYRHIRQQTVKHVLRNKQKVNGHESMSVGRRLSTACDQ